ncbi:MAG: SDR family NAD(P)-dependent oxidoreductase [Bacilli bacterium]
MKKILYTGASSGIARKVIKKLKREYYIYVSVHTKKQLELISKYYYQEKNIECIKLDITNKDDIKKINNLDIDILINNAAIGIGGSISEINMNKVRENFETNVFSSFTIVQIVLKQMIKKGRGRIIIMGSLAAIIPIKFLGVYCATKASIQKLTLTLQKEIKLINKKINIILIEPGLYKTGFNQVMLDNKYDFMEKTSYFNNELELIRKKETLFFKLLEHNKLNSIVNKIILAVKEKRPKGIYRAPITQVIGSKLYQLFK